MLFQRKLMVWPFDDRKSKKREITSGPPCNNTGQVIKITACVSFLKNGSRKICPLTSQIFVRGNNMEHEHALQNVKVLPKCMELHCNFYQSRKLIQCGPCGVEVRRMLSAPLSLYVSLLSTSSAWPRSHFCVPSLHPVLQEGSIPLHGKLM
jgi:hypothetical protein